MAGATTTIHGRISLREVVAHMAKGHHSTNFIDITGQRFGSLVAIRRESEWGEHQKTTKWICQCDCGNTTIVDSWKLRSGHTRSCGCKAVGGKKSQRDLTGERFGDLTVIRKTGKDSSGNSKWLCRCECGNEIEAIYGNITRGHTTSCGCIVGEKHEDKIDRLYNVWKSMHERCYDQNHKSYKTYGGIGVRICNEWLNSYNAFQSWAMENGYQPDAPWGVTTIDRIDPYGNYEPNNCRFVSNTIQQQNKRKRVIRHDK